VTAWCSGRGRSCAGRGRGFESRRPRCCEIYTKNAGDGRALAGGGLHRLKKIPFFFHFFPFFQVFFGSNFAECRALGKEFFADGFFTGGSLPSALGTRQSA